MSESVPNEDVYLSIIRDALGVCKQYKPKFGARGKDGLTVDKFRSLYREDAFYHWFGLDSPLMYKAHRAAGGITSVYRQLGIAGERLFRQLLQDQLGLTQAESTWSYQIPSTTEKKRTLSLDGRIPASSVRGKSRASRVGKWLRQAGRDLGLPRQSVADLEGAVFEIRQGYKSKDAKRQNADIANAANAYAYRYLPVLVLMSVQIDGDVAERYINARWLLLRGSLSGTPYDSAYVFCEEILGYDLAGFFARNSATPKTELQETIEALLE